MEKQKILHIPAQISHELGREHLDRMAVRVSGPRQNLAARGGGEGDRCFRSLEPCLVSFFPVNFA